MHKRFQRSSVALALSLAIALALGAQIAQRVRAKTTTTTASAATAGAALAALPASDVIIFVDTQRLTSDALPNFLAADPALLARANAKLERLQKETGLDAHSVESMAIGLRLPTASAPGDMKVVSILHGSFVASELIEAGFAAAKRKENIGREEQVYEGKKIYVLASARDQADAAADGGSAPRTDRQRMAIAEMDANTVVVGDLESVRATLNPSHARVDQNLVDLATRTPNAFASFAGNLAPGTTRGFGFGNSKADKLAASIRQIYGSVSTTGTEAQTLLAARTDNAEQAHDIAQAINGLKLLSKFGIGGRSGASRAEGEAISKLINSLSVTSQNNEVEIKLNVAQADIAPLMRRF
ncbi:MAG TPA: hypothetical protein VF553_14095 [Pyrinomonadaceae bacterium]|jgi:hypothetical protein